MISDFIYGIHPVLLLAFVLLVTISISLLCIWVFRSIIHVKENEIAEIKLGMYSDAFGVAFAILLGLIIVTAWKTYDKTEESVRLEVNYLNDLYHLSLNLDPPEREALRNNLKSYIDYVVHKEWRLLPQGKHSRLAEKYLNQNFSILFTTKDTALEKELLRDEMNSIATKLIEQRRLRIQNAESSLTGVMWMVILACSFVTLILLALGPKGSLRLHIVLQGIYALGIALMLFLMVVLDRPYYYGAYFGGGITPVPFQELLKEWDQKG